MKNINSQKTIQKGFSIVEMMISVTLFTAVVILGVGSLLSSNSVSKRTETARVALDSISFAMEDITRNLRLGSNYRCLSGGDLVNESPKDCQSSPSNHIALERVGGEVGNASDQIVYSIREYPGRDNIAILKSTDSGDNFVPITPPELFLDATRSGFTVIGAETQGGRQPAVLIRLTGNVVYQDNSTPFSFQTTISQRLPDLGL